jgi:prepilin-type N-terminal cleavage/methylation domain-containing protein
LISVNANDIYPTTMRLIGGSLPAGMKSTNDSLSGTRGFTLVEVMIVAGLVGLLAALAVPNALRARNTAAKQLCISNLRQIESAKEQWATETRQSSTDTAADNDLFGRDKYIRCKPKCPEGGAYRIGANQAMPRCSVAGHTL